MGICSAVFQSMPGAASWQQWKVDSGPLLFTHSPIHHNSEPLTDEVSLARRQLLLTFLRALNTYTEAELKGRQRMGEWRMASGCATNGSHTLAAAGLLCGLMQGHCQGDDNVDSRDDSKGLKPIRA